MHENIVVWGRENGSFVHASPVLMRIRTPMMKFPGIIITRIHFHREAKAGLFSAY